MTEEEKQAIASSSSQIRRRIPNDVVEEIFLRLPVKTLIRLRCLSKQWRSTIESHSFTEKQHLKTSKRSHPKLMVISLQCNGLGSVVTEVDFRTICSESASCLSSIVMNFPRSDYGIYVSESCNGLFCIQFPQSYSIYVVNPATRWLRQLPPARFQSLMYTYMIHNPDYWEQLLDSCFRSGHYPAFVKATDYKLVMLYNFDASSPNDGVTKCEVFDFRANAWRYLTCSPSHRIFYDQKPVCANGSVYWFTEPYNGEIKVVAFNIHTEKFRLLPKIHPDIASSDPYHDHTNMCILDNRVCMSTMRNKKNKEIWRLKSSEDSWEKIYTIDLLSCSSCLSSIPSLLDWTPVTICQDKKIWLSHCISGSMVKYDLQTKSVVLFAVLPWWGRNVSYFESLISHI